MKKKMKQALAIVGAIILVLMYVLLFVFAVLDIPNWQRFFFACLGATIIIPVFLWINFWLYERMVERRESEDDDVEISHRPDKGKNS